MPNTIAEAFAPATAANLGVGFDILGLALKEPGDIVRVERRVEPGVVIVDIHGDGGKLSRVAKENTASVAAQSVLNLIGATEGVALTLYKHLPLGSGLGSSAASAVAGAVATNALFGNPLRVDQLLAPALDGEAVASGYHPDNVGPSLFGGITLFDAPSVESMVQLPVPENLHLALVTPHISVKTADARAVLPHEVSLKMMIRQTGAVAKLVDALYRGDIHALGQAMERDQVVEPAREYLMPHFREVREACHGAGAYGLVISGAGPTLLAVCDNRETAQAVAVVMEAVYNRYDMACTVRSGQVCSDGARVLSVQSDL